MEGFEYKCPFCGTEYCAEIEPIESEKHFEVICNDGCRGEFRVSAVKELSVRTEPI